MTDPTARLQQLEHRLARFERDLARAVRIMLLIGDGHATGPEHEELRAIAERYPRYPAPERHPDS